LFTLTSSSIKGKKIKGKNEDQQIKGKKKLNKVLFLTKRSVIHQNKYLNKERPEIYNHVVLASKIHDRIIHQQQRKSAPI
jgi:hypothetical protein